MENRAERAERYQTLKIASLYCWPVYRDIDTLVSALDRTSELNDIAAIDFVREIVARHEHPRIAAASNRCLQILEIAAGNLKTGEKLLRPIDPNSEFGLRTAQPGSDNLLQSSEPAPLLPVTNRRPAIIAIMARLLRGLRRRGRRF